MVLGLHIDLSKCGLAGFNVQDKFVGYLAELTDCELLQFQILENSNTSVLAFSKLFWRVKVLSKVKAFVWTVVFNRINTCISRLQT